MDFTTILSSAKQELTALDDHLIDVVDITRPPTLDYAKNLAKVISKLSPLLGNMIEFSTVDMLNAHDWQGVGTWVRQDPGFPDALFQSETVLPNPGIEIKAWFPFATEITARFKDSVTIFKDNNIDMALIAWLPENVIWGKPKIIDVLVVSGKSVAEARDRHYHRPPDYLVFEPEDTSERTANLQQTNTNGYKLQHDKCDFDAAVRVVETWGEAGKKKWYVVNSSVTIAERITVSGDVHLILSNGCTLTASKGIGVTNGNSLTIYAQSTNESAMGELNAPLGKQSAYDSLAAIGGGGSQSSSGQITINGGKITATGGTNAAGIGGGKDESGTVTINGGFITATSQYNNATPGAAIGGGNNGSGIVTINGGHIVATGDQSAAGIGSGYAASATVTINGGIIEAHGGSGAAGIGSGKYWNDTSTTRQATVLIRGGTVVADTKSPTQSADGSAAIGGGAHSQGFVTIDGGHVTATAPKNCTCIGNYEVNYGKTGSVTINGGVVMARLDSSVQASDAYYGIGGAGCIVTLGWTNASDSITSPKWGGNGSSTVSFAAGKSFQYEDTHTLAEAASLRNGATLIPFVPAAQKKVDQADVSGAPESLQQRGFRELGGLAGTRRAADDDDLMRFQRGADFRDLRGNREVVGELAADARRGGDERTFLRSREQTEKLLAF